MSFASSSPWYIANTSAEHASLMYGIGEHDAARNTPWSSRIITPVSPLLSSLWKDASMFTLTKPPVGLFHVNPTRFIAPELKVFAL